MPTQRLAVQGKATFAGLLGLDAARARARELADEAAGAVSIYGKKVETLKTLARYIVARET